MSKLITILIPVYNEEESLNFLYERLINILKTINYNYEILFINDGSNDNSLEIMRELREKDKNVEYLNLARNYGKETAMAAGFDYSKGDATIIMDADLQDPPELIPEMIKFWEEGYDDVYAKRKSRQGETFLKKKTSEWFYKILKSMSKVPIQENTGDFRLLSRRAVVALREYKEQHRYTKGYFSLIGFNKKEILFDRDSRVAGKTKWNYFKLIELAIEGVTSFTSFPLRISTYVGSITALFSLIYMVIIIAKKLLFGNDVEGYPSLMTAILFFSSIQLLTIGIIGEYLGRIFNETKRRPLYFIDEYSGEKWNG